MDRNTRNVLHQRRSKTERLGRATQAVDFFNLLTSPELLATTEAQLPEHRERLYPPTVALSMFMRQVFETDGSCQKAVNGWAAQRAADGLSPCSVRTGGFCRARQRLSTRKRHLRLPTSQDDYELDPGLPWRRKSKSVIWLAYSNRRT